MLGQLVVQPEQRPLQGNLDGALAPSQDARDVLVPEVRKKPQLDHCPLVLGQTVEAGGEDEVGFHVLGPVRCRNPLRAGHRLIFLRGSAPSPQQVGDLSMGDAEDPGGKGRPAETCETTPRLGEHLAGDIIRVTGTDAPVGIPVDTVEELVVVLGELLSLLLQKNPSGVPSRSRVWCGGRTTSTKTNERSGW